MNQVQYDRKLYIVLCAIMGDEMEANNMSLSKFVFVGLLMLSVIARPVDGSIIARPIEYSLSAAHVIVTGKAARITPDKAEKRKLGSGSYTDYYRLGYVEVDEVLKNDLADFTVGSGDRVEVRLGPTAKRARALAIERSKDSRFISSGSGSPRHSTQKGDVGIWLLRRPGPEAPFTFSLYLLIDIDALDEMKGKLETLEREYQEALQNEIPWHAEIRKRCLSTPPVTQAMVDAAMDRTIPPEIDLSDVYVISYDNMQSLFMSNSGDILGGIPCHASARVFSEGYLPVATALDRGYQRYNYIDRRKQFLCEKFYSYTEPFREGRALVHDDNGYGFIDREGNEIIPCSYEWAESFSNGKARVRESGPDAVFIDKAGVVIGPDTRERSHPEGLIKTKLYDDDRKVNLWGFADRQGNTVIAPQFLHASDFSDGMATIETTVWAERSGLYGNPDIKFSDAASQHLLAARWGVINEEGKVTIPPVFDSVGPFQNGLAIVRIYLRPTMPGGNRVFEGLIDKAGNLVFVKSNPLL